MYIDEDGDAISLWALAKNWTPSQAQLDDCVARARVGSVDRTTTTPAAKSPADGGEGAGGEDAGGQVAGRRTLLDVRQLEESFSRMKFRVFKLPTTKQYIEPEELEPLLKKMLGFGSGKLEKKKIKKNGT